MANTNARMYVVLCVEKNALPKTENMTSLLRKKKAEETPAYPRNTNVYAIKVFLSSQKKTLAASPFVLLGPIRHVRIGHACPKQCFKLALHTFNLVLMCSHEFKSRR
jgi:hypothetical protein